jgi:hypothetical protein
MAEIIPGPSDLNRAYRLGSFVNLVSGRDVYWSAPEGYIYFSSHGNLLSVYGTGTNCRLDLITDAAHDPGIRMQKGTDVVFSVERSVFFPDRIRVGGYSNCNVLEFICNNQTSFLAVQPGMGYNQSFNTLVPSADNTWDLGTPANRWANVYAVNLIGNIVVSGTTSDSFTIDTDNTSTTPFLRLGSAYDKRLTWNNPNNRFEFNGNVYIPGKLTVTGAIDPTEIDLPDNAPIYLNTARTKLLRWNSSIAKFEFNDTIYTSGNIDAPNNPSCRAYRSGLLTIPNATWTTIGLDGENFDTQNMHNNVTNNSRITVPVSGKYLITGQISFSLNTTGFRGARILLNGATVLATRFIATTTWVPGVNVTTIESLNAGDYVEIQGYQASGSDLGISIGREYTYLAVQKVS